MASEPSRCSEVGKRRSMMSTAVKRPLTSELPPDGEAIEAGGRLSEHGRLVPLATASSVSACAVSSTHCRMQSQLADRPIRAGTSGRRAPKHSRTCATNGLMCATDQTFQSSSVTNPESLHWTLASLANARSHRPLR